MKQSKRRIYIYHRIVYWFFYFSIAFVFVQFSFNPYIFPHHFFDSISLFSFQSHSGVTTSNWKQQSERTHQSNIATWFLFLFHCLFWSSWTRQHNNFSISNHFLFNRWRDFYSQIVGDFNCCFDQFWIFETCHCRWRLFLQ